MSKDEDPPISPSSDEATNTPSRDNTPPASDDDGDADANNNLTKSEVLFAFGPQSWYFIRCGVRWRFVRSNASNWENLKIDNAYWVAFKHDTGFIIGGDDDEGGGKVVHSWNDGHMIRAEHVDSFIETRDAYIGLHDWISDQVKYDPEKIRQISLSIGPKGSYFACHGKAKTSHALPKDLQRAIEESESYPVTVALGKQGAWIVLFADGSRNWNLRHMYPTLASKGHLNNRKNRPVFAALNPYSEDEYFVVAENGGCSYKLGGWSTDEGARLHEMTDTYMRSRAIRDGTDLSHSGNVNGIPMQMRITPNSRPQESRTEAMLAIIRGRAESIKHRDVVFVGAIASGTGVLGKLAGLPTLRAVGLAASTSVGAACTLGIATG